MSFTQKIALLHQEMFSYIDNLKYKVYDLQDSEIYVSVNKHSRDVYWLEFQDRIGWTIGFDKGQWLKLNEIDIYETAKIVDYLKDNNE